MFKRRRGITLGELPKYSAKGYGQGEGVNYQPMIHVQDFPSRGWRNREIGFKTGRQHDYLSNLELNYHYILDWSENVTDFREQFPLPTQMTREISERLRIRHPYDRKTGELLVMTTDFLIILPQNIGFIKQARTVKPAKELLNRRTLEKFEIERQCWQAQGVHWGIVTEHEIDLTLVKRLKWIHKFLPVSSLAPLSEGDVRQIATTLTRMLVSKNGCLSNIALACDKQLRLKAGQSLAIARHLIASRQWLVDMAKPVHPLEKLELLGNSLLESKRKKGTSHTHPRKRIA
jgi:TnsA endonuclease N terminal/TnsA endonuclease C terminal